MDRAAAAFPNINFVIFHVGLPWLDETLWQIVRFPNLYASIAATVNFIARQPRVFAEIMGKLMWWAGEDKILFGGETPIWRPQWALEEFWKCQLPEDIVRERGYPQITEQAKRKILGENLLRLHGMDVKATPERFGYVQRVPERGLLLRGGCFRSDLIQERRLRARSCRKTTAVRSEIQGQRRELGLRPTTAIRRAGRQAGIFNRDNGTQSSSLL
jgi:Amidohydrolase